MLDRAGILIKEKLFVVLWPPAGCLLPFQAITDCLCLEAGTCWSQWGRRMLIWASTLTKSLWVYILHEELSDSSVAYRDSVCVCVCLLKIYFYQKASYIYIYICIYNIYKLYICDIYMDKDMERDL